MVSQIFSGRGTGVTAAGTWYGATGNGIPRVATSATVEATTQHKVRYAGTYSALRVYINASATTTASTIKLRINGGYGNLNVSVGAGLTGAFQDLSSTDAVAVNDLVNFELVVGTTGGFNERFITYLFQTTNNTETVTPLIGGSLGTTLAAATAYHMYACDPTGATTTEANVKCVALCAATLTKMRVYISTNSRDGTWTLISRKNAADGNMSIAVLTTQTGAFEDASNSDTLAYNDIINMKSTLAGTTGSLVIPLFEAHCVTAPNEYFTLSNRLAGINLNGVPPYFSVPNYIQSDASTENNIRQLISNTCAITGASFYMINNSVSNIVQNIRKNTSTNVITAAIPNSTTGSFITWGAGAEFIGGTDYASLYCSSPGSGVLDGVISTYFSEISGFDPFGQFGTFGI